MSDGERPDPGRVIRAPNHLGDVLMALPAIAADGADVVVLRWLAPILAMARLDARVHPLDRGLQGWTDGVRTLRRAAYRRGTLLTPAFSAAWLFRWGGVRRLRGTDTDARGLLLSDRVPREALRGRHRVGQFKLLLGQDPDPPHRPHPLHPPADAIRAWSARLAGDGPLVGLFPGSNAPARRWPAPWFAEVARSLAGEGARIVAMGSAGERHLTAAAVRGVPGAFDAGGATDLPGLAALLSVCDIVVTNDTGPMHLAGAVGTPTVTLWGSSDPAEVHPVGADHARVTGPPLPCKPCFKNVCPRSGTGTRLPEARNECLHLITVPQVTRAAVGLLGGLR